MLLRQKKAARLPKNSSWIVRFVAVCLFLTVILQPRFFSEKVLSIFSFLQNAQATFLGYWENLRNLSTENVLLKRQCHELHHQILMLQSQKEILEKRVRFSPFVIDFPYTFLTCAVVAVDILHHKALLRGGSNDNVQKGQVVVHPHGYILGRIESVGKNFSRMIFVSHGSFRLPVKGKQSGINGIIHGKKKDALFLHKESPHPLIQGETLVTSEYGGLCPAYIPLGIWSEKEKSVLPFMKNAPLEYVYIISSQKSEEDIKKMLQNRFPSLINEKERL